MLLKHSGFIHDLSSVCNATSITRILYASLAWRGYASNSDLNRLQSVINRVKRWGVLSLDAPCLANLLDSADNTLFKKVLSNPNHVMHSLLPPKKTVPYQLRPIVHDRAIPINSTLNSQNFISRMLLKDSY